MPAKKTSSPKPWDRPNPRSKHTKLTDAEKSAAKARAKRAGRVYPNLVDNMHVAAERKKKMQK